MYLLIYKLSGLLFKNWGEKAENLQIIQANMIVFVLFRIICHF